MASPLSSCHREHSINFSVNQLIGAGFLQPGLVFETVGFYSNSLVDDAEKCWRDLKKGGLSSIRWYCCVQCETNQGGQMSIMPVAVDVRSVQADEMLGNAPARQAPKDGEQGRAGSVADQVDISKEGRAKAGEMNAEKAPEQNQEREDDNSKSFTINRRSEEKKSDAGKEEAVDELKDTESEIRKKHDELQEAKTVFFGSDDDQEKKIKELQQDIDDLKDTKKELESKLAT